MKCPKCGSENVSIYLEKSRSGLIDVIAVIFLMCIPIVGWAILIFNRPYKQKVGLCQNCAHSFEIKIKRKSSKTGIILALALLALMVVMVTSMNKYPY